MSELFQKIKIFLSHLFAAYGLLWLLTSIVSFFTSNSIDSLMKSYWVAFALTGIAYALYKIRPKTEFTYKIPQRDTEVSVVNKNIFKIEGSLIIPVNNKFLINQDGNLLSSSSILCQFVKSYYDSDPSKLQNEINGILSSGDYVPNNTSTSEYDIGTTICINAKGKNFYFLANTQLNAQNKSHCDKDIFETSLNVLWTYLSECASKEIFIIPLLGTGNGRLTISRERVFREIVLSFISSLSTKNYAEKLVICINPNDIDKHNLKFENLGDFLRAKVIYSEFASHSTIGTNTLS